MRRRILCTAAFLIVALTGPAAAEARTRFSFGFSFGFGRGHYRPYPHQVFRPYYPYRAYVPGYYGAPYYHPPVFYRGYYPAPVVRYYKGYTRRDYGSYAPRRQHRGRNYADYQPRRYYQR